MHMAGRALAVVATGMLLLAFGSSLGLTIAHAQAAPTLELDPSSGGVGTTVQIAGRGFCGSPACSSVRVSFAGIVVADGIGVGTDGRFAQSLTVPGGIPPGEKAVAATQTNASGERGEAIATFQVTLGGATATASPTSTATPTGSPTGSPTTSVPPATTVIVPPAASGGGSSTGLTLAMVAAAAAFVTALMGMAYVLWRSREIPVPPPPAFGPITPHEEVGAGVIPPGYPESESPAPSPEPPKPPEPPEPPAPSEPPGPPEPPAPPEGSGEGQTAG
jgi:hypothetical protein